MAPVPPCVRCQFRPTRDRALCRPCSNQLTENWQAAEVEAVKLLEEPTDG